MPLLHELSPHEFFCVKCTLAISVTQIWQKCATPLYGDRKAMEIITQTLGIHKGIQIYKTIVGNKLEISLLKEAFVI